MPGVVLRSALLEKVIQLCLGTVGVVYFVGTVFKGEVGAEISALTVCYVFGYVLATLIMSTRIPVFTIFAAMHVLRAVRAGIVSLHFNTVKIDLVVAVKAEMMSFFCFWYIHL